MKAINLILVLLVVLLASGCQKDRLSDSFSSPEPISNQFVGTHNGSYSTNLIGSTGITVWFTGNFVQLNDNCQRGQGCIDGPNMVETTGEIDSSGLFHANFKSTDPICPGDFSVSFEKIHTSPNDLIRMDISGRNCLGTHKGIGWLVD